MWPGPQWWTVAYGNRACMHVCYMYMYMVVCLVSCMAAWVQISLEDRVGRGWIVPGEVKVA